MYHRKIISKEMINYLYVGFPNTPMFFSLPKTHKNYETPPGHPIIAGIDSTPLEKVH